MSKKKPSSQLLTLISGSEVHMPSHTKVIDGTLFSELLEGQKMLALIKKESKQYKIDMAKDCEAMKEKGYRDGFQEGFENWLDQVAAFEKKILDVKAELEKSVMSVALKAAKKIVCKEVELNKEAIVDIVRYHLKAVAQHKKVTLWVSPDNYDILEKEKNSLKTLFEALEALSVRPREDITPGGCIIETEVGIINATIENQWAIIEKVFEKLDVKKGEALS